MGCIGSRTIAADAVPGDWKDSKELDSVNVDSTVSLHGSTTQPSSGETRTEISWDGINLSMEDTTSILPSLKKSSNPYGIGALAKSSLSVRLHTGLSKTVKAHVTRPTAMGSGRMAHMIEWQGWRKQVPPVPHSQREGPMDPDAYSELSDGEKEARFVAGVMKQFAISEATLMAWSSVDGEEISNVSTPGQSGLTAAEEGSDQHDPCLPLFPGDSWPQLISQGMFSLERSPGEHSASDLQLSPRDRLELDVLGMPREELSDGIVLSPTAEGAVGVLQEERQSANPLSRKVSDVTSSGVQSLEEDEEGV